MKRLALLLLLLSACSAKEIVSKSDITVQSGETAKILAQPKPLRVAVIDPRDTRSGKTWMECEKILQLAAMELRLALRNTGKFDIYLWQGQKTADFVVKVGCDSFIPDTTKEDSDFEIPVADGGLLFLQTMSVVAGSVTPIGALIASFDGLTGLALGSEEYFKQGVVILDISATSKRGSIVYAEPWAASFTAKAKVSGGKYSMSNHVSVLQSFPQDAIRAAVAAHLDDLIIAIVEG